MSERPQRTRVRIGPREVEVALFKTSGSMPQAQHDTRRVDEHGELIEEGRPSAAAALPGATGGQREHRAAASRPTRLTKAPAEYRHGVTVDGDFIDLTELLDAIDERNKLDAAEINSTVPNRTLPRLRIRDAYYVAPAEPDALPFLSHLWVGLHKTDSAALMRWSKRTNQALGALVPARSGGRADGAPILIVLELEWAAAMRPAPAQAWLDVTTVSEAGADAVTEAMRALRRTPEVWDELRDERNAQRAEALDAARRGEKWTPPESTEDETAELGEAILAAVR